MASLLDKSKGKRLVRGPGGSLSYQTEESIGDASARLGLPSAPRTALGAAGIGANKDQQKMAPLQNLDAGQETLQQARRTQQFRGQMNEQEQAKREKSQQLQQLGGMGDRIQAMLDSELSSMQAQQQQLQVAEDLSGHELAEGFTEPQLRQALTDFAAGSQEALVTINQALGKSPDAPLTSTELMSLFGDLDAQTAQDLANAAPDKILIDEPLAQDLGFESMDQLADLLGVTSEQLSTMNVNQLDETVQRLQAEEFQQVEALRQRALNPNISAAERAAIGDQLRALGASGVRATEEQVADLNEDLARAEVVSIGGQEMTIEQALSDENISAMVADYLADPESKLAEALPDGFKEFIERNRDALEDAAGELEEDTTAFSDIQKENLGLGDTDYGQIPDSVLDNMFGEGWKDQFRTEKIDTSSWPGFQLLEGDSLRPDEKANMVAGMSKLADFNPELASQIMQLDERELMRMGVIAKPGSKASKDWNNYLRQLSKAEELRHVSPKDLDGVLDAYFGGDVDSKQMRAQWQEQAMRAKLGLGNSKLYNKYKGIFGGDMNPKKLYQRMTKAAKLGDLRNYRGTLMPQADGSLLQQMKDANRANSFWNKVGSEIKDGHVEDREVDKMFRRLSRDELEKLANNPKLRGRHKLRARLDKEAAASNKAAWDTVIPESNLNIAKLDSEVKTLDKWKGSGVEGSTMWKKKVKNIRSNIMNNLEDLKRLFKVKKLGAGEWNAIRGQLITRYAKYFPDIRSKLPKDIA